MSLYPTGEVPEILRNLFKSPRDWTDDQREAAIKRIATLSTRVIRERQDVIAAQMRMPAAQRDPNILADLQEMYSIESEAVALKEFSNE